MHREVSRPAKLPYILSEQMLTISIPKEFQRIRARSIKPAPCGDVKCDVVYREQNPSTVLAVERHERLWSVRLKQDGEEHGIWGSMSSLA